MPAQKPLPWQDFDDLLSTCKPATDALHELLFAEREALQHREYGHYQQLLTEKHQLLDQLQEGARLRSAWLTEHQLDDRSGLALASEQAPEVGRRWQELAQRWSLCQRENRVNEQVAGRTRQVVGQVLDILRGATGERLYDAEGQARRVAVGQLISDA